MNDYELLVCDANQVQLKAVVITEMRWVCGTLENGWLRFTIRMVRNWRTYMVFLFFCFQKTRDCAECEYQDNERNPEFWV